MTENTDTTTPPAAPLATARPPLRRSTSNRVLAGVSGGIAEWLGIDPIIVRVVLVVLAVFGGSGLVLYAIGWLFIPEAGQDTSEAERFIAKGIRPGSGLRTALIVGAAVVGTIVVLNLLSSSNGLWVASGGGSLILLVAVGALVLWLVNRSSTPGSAITTAPMAQQAPAVPVNAGTAVDADTAVDAQVHDTPAGSVDAPAEASATELPAGFAYGGYGQYPGYVAPTPVPPAPRKPRSYLGLGVLSLALIVMGVLASLSLSGVAYIPAVVVFASGLGVMGVGLLVGAFVGRAKWLMWLAVPLLVLTAALSVIPANLHLPRSAGIGDRNWVPTTAAEAARTHTLTVGDARLDLTALALAPGTTTPITADVGIGSLEVVAPPGMRVEVVATSGLGEVRVEGLPQRDGTNVTVIGELDGAVSGTAPTVELNVQAGIGEVEVRRA